MKKIVFVMEQLYGGGAERVTAALMNELCAEAEIHLLSTRHHDAAEDFPTDSRIIKHIIGKSEKRRTGVILERIAFLRRTIAEINPYCVVSLATTRTDILLKLAMRGMKNPVVLSERNDPVRFPESGVLRKLRHWIYQSCDGLVFQTREAQSYFSPAVQAKSVIICNPLTGNLPPRYEGVRERRIVNCCRLTAQKNLDLLIDAFSDVAAEYPDVMLEIWGEGSERARLEEKIRALRLTERIRLPGYTSDAYGVMWKSLMFVSSSDYEGISNSMLEAIALGVPTICTDCPAGGAREVIRHGENGFLVPTGDRAAMADAMRTLLSDPEMAESISRNGCQLRNDISADVIAQRWLAYIRQTADGNAV